MNKLVSTNPEILIQLNQDQLEGYSFERRFPPSLDLKTGQSVVILPSPCAENKSHESVKIADDASNPEWKLVATEEKSALHTFLITKEIKIQKTS